MQLPNPIRRLPFKCEDGTLNTANLQIVPMTQSLVEIWMQNVQPIVNAEYQHSAPDVDEKLVRADVNWDWNQYFSFHRLGNAIERTTMIGANFAPTIALCLVVETLEGDLFPVGMLIAHRSFKCTVRKVKRRRLFTWYLADAPSEIYGGALLPEQPRLQGVAKALIDTSIQISLASGFGGEILLHACEKGGAKLIKFYRDGCRMIQLDSSDPIISFFRANQARDRFFYMDIECAAEFSRMSDVYREDTEASAVAQV